MEKVNSKWCILFIILCQVSIFAPMGSNLAALNPTTPAIEVFVNQSFQVRFNVTSSQHTNDLILRLAQSMEPVGALVGALTTHAWLKYMSRRTALVVVHVISLVSVVLMAPLAYFAHSYELLIVGRWLNGVARGVGFSVGPLYVAEITHRKALSRYQSMIGWLILLSAALENVVAHPWVWGSAQTWPLALAFPSVFSLIFLCFLPWLPHTVPYLIMAESGSAGCTAKGHETDAPSFQLLKKLRSEDAGSLLEEYASIRAEIIDEQELEKASVLKLLCIARYRRQMVAVVVLQLAAQSTGTAVLLQFTNAILTNAGVKGSQTTYYAVGIFGLMAVTMIMATRLLERFGSKRMMVVGMAVVVVGQTLLCLSTSLSSSVPEMGIVGILSVAVFSIGAGAGPMLTITAFPSEITTIVTRPQALWFGATFYWLTSSVASTLFPVIIAKIHGFAYLPFIGFVIAMNLYIVFYVPETHHKSVSQIQMYFGKKPTDSDNDGEKEKLLSPKSERTVP